MDAFKESEVVICLVAVFIGALSDLIIDNFD